MENPHRAHPNTFLFFFETEGRQANAKHRRQLTTWQIFRQVERRIHNQDSNRQPLPFTRRFMLWHY